MPTGPVFISHSATDREAAESICQALETAGIRCWIAPRDIAPASAWADEIIAGIDATALVLLVHSISANSSPMVRRELDVAADRRKPLLPVRIDTSTPQHGMRFYLGGTHWFEAPLPLSDRLPALVEAVRVKLNPQVSELPQGFPEFSFRPAIAVLPFRSEAAEEPLADGLTEDLISAFSAWRSFPVIARNSVFAFRGGDSDLRQIGRSLSARYIVSGAFRRRGTVLRLTLELADAESAELLLSQAFDHDAKTPLVALQDDAVAAVAGILAPEIMKQERERAGRGMTADPSSYHLFQRAMWHRYRNTREEVAEAELLLRRILETDPAHVRARTALSLSRNFSAISRFVPDPQAAHAESLELARRAVGDDPRDPHARFALGLAYCNLRRLPDGIAELREAVRLNPSHAFARANLGQALNFQNQFHDGHAEVLLALRLNPHDPQRYMWLPYLAASRYLMGDYLGCLDACRQALEANPEFPLALRYMLAALGQMGRVEEARPLSMLLRRIDRDYAGIETVWRRLFVADAADHLLAGVRLAGFD